MSQVKISELSAIVSGTITGAEVFPAVQSAVDKKVSITQVQNFMGVYSGTGSPTTTPSNGSIYLRNDGGTATTIYARVGGGWIALGAGSSDPLAGRPTFAPLGLNGWQAQVDEGWDTQILDHCISASVKPAFIRFNFLQFHDYRSGNGTYTAEWLSSMQTNSIGHTMTLFYGATPWNNDYTGFATFARSAINWHTTNFPGVLKAVEIWNEGDGAWPLNTTQYVGVTRAIWSAIHDLTAYNTFPVIGPVITSPFNIGYLAPWVTAGADQYLDAFSFHAYSGPEYLIFDYHNFRTVVGSSKPVYISEWDYNTAQSEKVARRLSIMKFLGVYGASYFPIVTLSPTFQGIVADFSGSHTNVTDNWIEWYDKIGDSATFVTRDSINANAFSLKFNDKNGAPIRHMFALEPTPVLITDNAGVTSSAVLSELPIYRSGTSTVTLDPTADVLMIHTQWNFTTSATAADGWRYNWTNMTTSASGGFYPADPWHWRERDGTEVLDIQNIGYHGCYPFYRTNREYIVSATGTVLIRGYSYLLSSGDGANWRFRHISAGGSTTLLDVAAVTQYYERDFFLVRSVMPSDIISFEFDGNLIPDTDIVTVVGGIYSTNRSPTNFLNWTRDTGTLWGVPFQYQARATAGSTETTALYTSAGWVYTTGSAGIADADWSIQLRSAGVSKMRPGTTQNVLKRWVAPKTSTVRLTGGYFTSGTAVDVYIYRNASGSNTLLYSNPVTSASATASFDLTATVAAGHSIDLEVGMHTAASVGTVYFVQSSFISFAVS